MGWFMLIFFSFNCYFFYLHYLLTNMKIKQKQENEKHWQDITIIETEIEFLKKISGKIR